MRITIIIFAVIALVQSLPLSFLNGLMPFGGAAHLTTTVVGSKIYVFGGMTNLDLNGSNYAYYYDTTTGEWSEIKSMPYVRFGMCSATDGERIWIFGGYDERLGQNSGLDFVGTYFVTNNTWTYSRIPHYVTDCSAAYNNETNKVLIVYGFAPAWMYDPDVSSDQFTDLSANFPSFANTRDVGAGSVLYDNKLWLAGSIFNNSALRTVTLDGLSWAQKSSNPNGFSFVDLVTFDDIMLTFGGNNDTDDAGAGYSYINMYNVTSDTWMTLDAELPLPLNGVSAQLVGPSIYLFGGLYVNETDAVLLDKSWIVPCVVPATCEYGCNTTNGRCNGPQSPTSVVPSGSEPTTVPVIQIGTPSQTTPVASPKSKTSSASSYNALLRCGFAVGVVALLF